MKLIGQEAFLFHYSRMLGFSDLNREVANATRKPSKSLVGSASDISKIHFFLKLAVG